MHLSLATFDDDQFLLRGSPGKYDFRVIFQNIVELILVQFSQFRSVYHASLGVSDKINCIIGVCI